MPSHLRLEDLSDMAVLEAFSACLNGSNDVSTQELAAVLELDVEHPARFVGARLGWLRRLGVIERDGKTGRWFFTAEGHRLYLSRTLTSRENGTLERLFDEHSTAIAERMASEMLGASSTQFGLLRRQVRHAELRRRLGYR